MSLAYDVSVNLVSGVLSAGISTASIFLYIRSKNLLFARRLWRLTDPSSLSVAVSTSLTPRPGLTTGRPGTGVGQLRAIAALSPSLVRAYGRQLHAGMVVLSDEIGANHHLGDLIVLGGPRTNRVTAAVFAEEPGLPVYMKDAPRADGSGRVDSRIHWAPAGSPVQVLDTAEEGPYVYGMILRHLNVLDRPSGGRLWVIAGTSTFGTQAAAQWIATNQRHVRRIRGIVALVVRAQKPAGLEGHVSTPELFLAQH